MHAIMSVIASAMFAGVTFLLVMADHDLNPMSKSLLSSPQSLTELKVMCLRVCRFTCVRVRACARCPGPAPHVRHVCMSELCSWLMCTHLGNG